MYILYIYILCLQTTPYTAHIRPVQSILSGTATFRDRIRPAECAVIGGNAAQPWCQTSCRIEYALAASPRRRTSLLSHDCRDYLNTRASRVLVDQINHSTFYVNDSIILSSTILLFTTINANHVGYRKQRFWQQAPCSSAGPSC